MDRNRNARRLVGATGTSMVTTSTNGLSSRRRHRNEDSGVELQESIRLTDRVKKDRDRERDRDKSSSRSKRRRSDERLMMHRNGVNGLDDDTSEESVNDDEEEDDYFDDNDGGVRLFPAGSSNNFHHRKITPVWKSGDEMIGVPIPRKARSGNKKRVHQSPVPAGTPAHPVSPKKFKFSNGIKQKPLKSSSSKSEELEIEIAEVLSGLMTHPQASSKKEISAVDAKSRVSSPISTSNIDHPSSISPQNPISITAPKKKLPRQVIDNMGSSSVRNSPKAEIDHTSIPKTEILSSNTTPSLTMGPTTIEYDSKAPPKQPEEPPVIEETGESQPLVINEEIKRSNLVRPVDSVFESTKKSKLAETLEDEKFKIDLMAPPPYSKLSPERVMEIEKPSDYTVKDKSAFEENESHKLIEIKGKNLNLGVDLENPKREGPGIKETKEDPHVEKMGQSNPSPPPKRAEPCGLAHMGPAHLQGVVYMNGSNVPPQQMPVFSQPRPKKCATHWYIAKNIDFLQQFTKMNPYANPMASSSPSNLNGAVPLPSIDIGVTNVHDKGQNGLSVFPSHGASDKASQPPDIAQRQQQIMMHPTNNIMHGPGFLFPVNQQQVAMTTVASTQLGFSKASTVTAGGGGGLASDKSSSATVGGGGAATAISTPPPGMSFSYPNMAVNEAQYLALLQNNGYPLPIPGIGGVGPPNYGVPHPHSIPMFNGSFYPSQIIHPPPHHHPPPPPGQNRTSQQPQVRHVETPPPPATFGGAAPTPHDNSESLPPHSYWMSFGSTINGGPGPGPATGFNPSSIPQNQAMFHNYQEANCQKMHMSQSQAQAVHQKKNGNEIRNCGTTSLGGVHHNAQLHAQMQQLQLQQQQQLMHLHNQQQLTAHAPVTRKSNVVVQDASSIMAANLISTAQQIKASGPGYLNQLEEAYSNIVAKYPSAVQVQPPPQAKNTPRTTTTTTTTTTSQAPARTTQISFNSNQKLSSSVTVTNNQSTSPTSSSISKGGSPRTNNSGLTSSDNRNIPSNLGNNKTMQQQAQMFFSNPYVQAQFAHSNPSANTPFYLQRSETTTTDPSKSGGGNGGSGGQGIYHGAQFAGQSSGLIPGYSYAVPSAFQVKPNEQKQPAGKPEKK